MTRQYVTVRYRDEDKRTYTYHNDDKPVAEGDIVKVPSARTDGWMRATVTAVGDEAPRFATKQIMGVIAPDAPKLL